MLTSTSPSLAGEEATETAIRAFLGGIDARPPCGTDVGCLGHPPSPPLQALLLSSKPPMFYLLSPDFEVSLLFRQQLPVFFGNLAVLALGLTARAPEATKFVKSLGNMVNWDTDPPDVVNTLWLLAISAQHGGQPFEEVPKSEMFKTPYHLYLIRNLWVAVFRALGTRGRDPQNPSLPEAPVTAEEVLDRGLACFGTHSLMPDLYEKVATAVQDLIKGVLGAFGRRMHQAMESRDVMRPGCVDFVIYPNQSVAKFNLFIASLDVLSERRMADTLTQNTSGTKLKLGSPGGAKPNQAVEVAALQKQIATMTLTIKELRSNPGNGGQHAPSGKRQRTEAVTVAKVTIKGDLVRLVQPGLKDLCYSLATAKTKIKEADPAATVCPVHQLLCCNKDLEPEILAAACGTRAVCEAAGRHADMVSGFRASSCRTSDPVTGGKGGGKGNTAPPAAKGKGGAKGKSGGLGKAAKAALAAATLSGAGCNPITTTQTATPHAAGAMLALVSSMASAPPACAAVLSLATPAPPPPRVHAPYNGNRRDHEWYCVSSRPRPTRRHHRPARQSGRHRPHPSARWASCASRTTWSWAYRQRASSRAWRRPTASARCFRSPRPYRERRASTTRAAP